MHVAIEDSRGEALDLKWRGTALETFDGRRWTNNVGFAPFPLRRSADGRFDLERQRRYTGIITAARRGFRPLRYRVLMEPIGVNMFFLVPRADLLLGNYRDVLLDENAADLLDATLWITDMLQHSLG